MKKLYKFEWYLYYANCEGLFIATEEEIKAVLGRELYFGEIEGKHSEIYGVLEEKDLTVLTDDQDFIGKFEKYAGGSFGYNPLNYLSEEERRRILTQINQRINLE